MEKSNIRNRNDNNVNNVQPSSNIVEDKKERERIQFFEHQRFVIINFIIYIQIIVNIKLYMYIYSLFLVMNLVVHVVFLV